MTYHNKYIYSCFHDLIKNFLGNIGRDVKRLLILSPFRIFLVCFRKVGINPVHFFQGNKLVLLELNGEFISAWDNIASKLAGIQGAAPPLGVKNFRVK